MADDSSDESRPPVDGLQSMREQVAARIDEEVKEHPAKDDESGSEDAVSSSFVRECVKANDLGLGVLYATLLRKQCVYVPENDEWYWWKGHSWQLDIMRKTLTAIETVVSRLADEIAIIGKEISEASKNGAEAGSTKALQNIQRLITKKILFLRTPKGRRSCLEMAATCKGSLAVNASEFNNQHMLLACKNGVWDLSTGEFRDGRPDDYISLASPVEAKGLDVQCELWEKTVMEIFNENDELVAYIHRLFGYTITGVVSEQIFPILWGKGRNGKGTIVKIISYILGDMAGAVKTEFLLEQRMTQSASSADPATMAARDRRFLHASETDKGRKLSLAKIKQLTGDDEMVGRNNYDKYDTRFQPTHKLFLQTNPKPRIQGGDFAFAERLHMIPFEISYVHREPEADNERRAVKGLADNLIKDEAAGILAWCVRGCLLWQQHGLKPPDIVTETTKEYLKDEDDLGRFIDECCVAEKGAWVGAKEVYECYLDWYEENIGSREKAPKQKSFGSWFGERFKKKKISTNRYLGVRLKEV